MHWIPHILIFTGKGKGCIRNIDQAFYDSILLKRKKETKQINFAKEMKITSSCTHSLAQIQANCTYFMLKLTVAVWHCGWLR